MVLEKQHGCNWDREDVYVFDEHDISFSKFSVKSTPKRSTSKIHVTHLTQEPSALKPKYLFGPRSG